MTRVLVVGAGIGGVASAGRLARRGFDVTVLEKNSTPGGRCNQLRRDGHRFDIGPSLYLMPEVFAETYAALGERVEDHLDLRRIDPTYTVRFDDRAGKPKEGDDITLTADINAMQRQLEAIEPGSFGSFLRYLAEGNRHYRLSLERFVGRNFYTLFEYFSLTNLPLLFQLKALQRHYSHIGKYFQHPHLKAAFTFQDMYLGLSPYDSPATYSLLQYTELADGVWFPMGGMYRIIESLTSIAEGQGARFEYDAPVKTIEVEGDRARGIVLEDGRRLSADIVIANADLPYVYDQLLPDRAAGERMMRKKFTCSAILFYWAMDKTYPALAHHNVFLAGDYLGSFERIFKDHVLPDQPSFYIHAPARTDPTAAPAGQDTLMVLVPMGHLVDGQGQDLETLKARARQEVLRRLARMGISDIGEHLKWEVCYTPQDWKQMFNLAKGATFGLGHNFTQVGYLRPRNRHAHYGNLYFASASTHPGTGLPIVLLSARLIEERILKEQGAPARR